MTDVNEDGHILSAKYKAFIWTGGPDQVHDPVWFIEYLKAHKAFIHNCPLDGVFIKGISGIALPGDVIVHDGKGGYELGGPVRFYSPVAFRLTFGESDFAALEAGFKTNGGNENG